jgi:site-specific recombinase XerD
MARRPKPWYRESHDTWYFWDQGVQRSLYVKGRDAEDEAWVEFHKRMSGAKPETGRGPSGRTVKELCDLLLAHNGTATARSTVEFYERHLTSFCERQAETLAAEIRPFHVSEWVNGEGWSDTTKSGAIGCVKRVFRWAKKQGYIDSNPIADMERPRIAVRQAIMTQEQFRQIIETTPDAPWRNLLTALWETGCRPGELIGLTAAGVDLKAKTWTVVNKTRHHRDPTRTIDLTDQMFELSRTLCECHPKGPIFLNLRGRPWTRNAMACRFSHIRKRLGFGGEATSYALRHMYITDGLENGVEIATMAELVGHANTTMITRVYSKLSQRREHMRAAAAKVRPKPDA